MKFLHKFNANMLMLIENKFLFTLNIPNESSLNESVEIFSKIFSLAHERVLSFDAFSCD